MAALLRAEPVGAGVVGVEREYRMLDANSEPVDFRTLVRTIGLPGFGLDPTDPNAHHLPCGVLITADGPEAEVATPPIALSPGWTRHVTAWAERGEDALVAALPTGSAIEGFSTHLNVSVTGDVVAVASLFARRFAVGMMLLLDRRDSPGLLVRPRPGRLELGGDFADGEQLRVALTYAAAAARTCATAVRTGATVGLPPVPDGRIVAAKDRPGWFVDRAAFAPDLYETGRTATIRCAGAARHAGDHLVEAWTAARVELDGVLDPTEMVAVDDVVEGRRPIPIEALSAPDNRVDNVELDSPFGHLSARDRGAFHVGPAAISWAAVAFKVESPLVHAHVVVPRRWLPSFLASLDQGELDEVLADGRPLEGVDRGPRVVREGFDPRCVVPPEPVLRRSRLRAWRPELIGLVAGCAAAIGLHQVWPW